MKAQLPVCRVAANGVQFINPVMGSEDFPVFTQNIPGICFFLGVMPEDKDPSTVPVNHSPLFFADDGALITGVQARCLPKDVPSGASLAEDHRTMRFPVSSHRVRPCPSCCRCSR